MNDFKGNFLLISYEKDEDGEWELMNTYFPNSTINDIIQNYFHNDDVLIINIIRY